VDNSVSDRADEISANYPVGITVWITYVLGIDTEPLETRDRGHSPPSTLMLPGACSGH